MTFVNLVEKRAQKNNLRSGIKHLFNIQISLLVIVSAIVISMIVSG